MAEVFSIEVEKQCLAGLIRNPQVWADIMTIVTDEGFHNEAHRTIFQTVRVILNEGEATLDTVLLSERIRNLNITFKEDIDVFAYIDSLSLITINEKATIDSFKELMKIKLRRDLWLDAKKVQKKMETCGNASFDEIVSSVDSIFSERINKYDLQNEPVDLFAGMEALVEERGNNPREESGLIPPYHWYRKLYGGFSDGDLYAWVARAKAGKSTLLADIMRKVCNESNPDVKVFGLMLDTELETERVQMRLVASLAGVNEWYLKTGKWRQNPQMVIKVRAAWQVIKPWFSSIDHIYVGGKPIEEVISIIKRWHAKKIRSKAAADLSRKLGKEIKAIVSYDYLKMTGEKVNDANKEHQVIGQKVDRLKQTGTQLQCPMLTACQMNRSGENRKDASKISDDGSAVAMSDRLSWFASFVGIFRKKTIDEIAEDGADYGTHKMIPIYTRNQGEDGAGFFDLVKCLDDEGNEYWRENFLNFKVDNFNVTELGTLHDIAKRRRGKFDIGGKPTEGVLL